MSDDVFLDYAGDPGAYLFNGADGYDTIIGTWTTGAAVVFDLRNDTLVSIEQLEIGSLVDGAGPPTGSHATMKLYASQVPIWFVGNDYDRPSWDAFEITMGSATALDLSTTGIGYFARGDHIRIIGDSANETITGSWGTDVIRGGGGRDRIDGGDGRNIADYTDKTEKVKITLKDGQWVDAVVGGIKEDKLHNINSIFGGRAGDKLTGDGNANYFAGGRGKDTLDGGGGIDTVDYSDKSKRVEVTLNKSHDVTVRVGKSAEDIIRNFENIVGGKAGDILTGDSRANMFVGGGGRDTIDGAGGLDLADYSQTVSGVKVALNGSKWATVSVGGKSEDRIRNIEKLLGGYGNDTLTGNGGANTLQGAVGKDRLDGKGGNDTADYSDRPWAISADLSGSSWSTVKVNGIAEDRIRRIENVVGSFDDDSITGDGKANSLSGGSGNDTLYGSGGIDTLKGGNGNDELRVAAGVHPKGIADGGSGTDRLSIRDNAGSYTADLRALTIKSIEVFEFGNPGAGGTATMRLKASQFAIESWVVHATIVGSGQNDHLVIDAGGQIDLSDLLFQNFAGRISVIGDKDGSHIYGSIRADSIVGGSKQDFLNYSPGYDTLDGGANSTGSGNSDQVSFAGAIGGITLTLNGSSNATYWVNGVASGVVRNIEYVVGSQGDDSITGDGNDNWINTQGGSDTLDGGGGIDTLILPVEGSMNTVVDLAAGTYTASFPDNWSGTFTNFENVRSAGTVYGDDHANRLEGGMLGDSLFGRGGQDHLSGSMGDDTLDGGAGVDVLKGDWDDDTFLFSALSDSGIGSKADVIEDFDEPEYSGSGFDDVIDVSGIYAGKLAYRGTGAFTDVGQLRVRTSGSDVIVEVNATGDLSPDFAIRLRDVDISSMTKSDFIL